MSEDTKKNDKTESIDTIGRAWIPCRFTIVLSYTKIVFNGYEHAGVLTHRCSLEKGHKEKCKCKCGVEFYGWE